MELTQLRYFHKVAQTGSITRAAKELNISQPTLTKSLHRLQSDLGCSLFIHTPGKPLRLNEAGKAFFLRIDKALAQIDSGIQAVTEYTQGRKSHVVLGTSVAELCCEITLNYYNQHPDARVTQRLVETSQLLTLLREEEIDFAISPCPLDRLNPDILSIPLFHEEFFVIVGPEHHLYGRKEVSLEELRKEKFICNMLDTDRRHLEFIFGPDSAELDIFFESNEPMTTKRMLEQSTAVTFVPARVIMRRMESGDPIMQSPIRLTSYNRYVPTCISTKKGTTLHGAAQAYYDFVVQFCQNEQQLVEYFLRQTFPHTE